MLVSANLSKLYDDSIADFFYGKPAGKHIAKEIKKDRLNTKILETWPEQQQEWKQCKHSNATT